MKLCWHCGSTEDKIGVCNCAVCAPYPAKWASCEACIGRRMVKAELERLPPDFDIADSRNWVYHAPEPPSRGHRRLS